MIKKIKGYFKLRQMAIRHTILSYDDFKDYCKDHFNKIEIETENVYFEGNSVINFILDDTILVIVMPINEDNIMVQLTTNSFEKAEETKIKISL